MTATERSPASPSPTRPWRRCAIGLVLALLPGLLLASLYATALDYEHVWTDTSAIAAGTMLRPEGEIVQAFAEPLHRIEQRGDVARQSYYRPLQVVLLSLVDARVGSQPRDFRSAGLLVGATLLGAFALFAWWLLGAPAAALFAALFVALHPVGIECFVWIAGISGPLASGFALAAIALGLVAATARSRGGAAAAFAVSILALAAALLSKERALIEPALLAASLLAFARRVPPGAPVSTPRGLAIVAAHVLVATLYWTLLRPAVLGGAAPAVAPIADSFATQWLSAVANWPARLAWIFVPLHSSTSDVLRVVESAADPRFLTGVALAAGSILLGLHWLRHGRALAALGLAWIWLAFLPTAGLLPMLHADGERYVFLSTFGAGLLLADLGCALAARFGRAPVLALAALALGFLAWRTSARLPDWESNLGLFEAEVARDPAYREAWFLVANEYYQRGDLREAERALETLLARGPEFAGTTSYWNPLATSELACDVYYANKRYAAVLELERDLARSNPGVLAAAPLRVCIARATLATGDYARALALYEGVEAELGADTPPGLYLMLARAHFLLGDPATARVFAARARRKAGPDHALRAAVTRFERSLGDTSPQPSAPTSEAATP